MSVSASFSFPAALTPTILTSVRAVTKTALAATPAAGVRGTSAAR